MLTCELLHSAAKMFGEGLRRVPFWVGLSIGSKDPTSVVCMPTLTYSISERFTQSLLNDGDSQAVDSSVKTVVSVPA